MARATSRKTAWAVLFVVAQVVLAGIALLRGADEAQSLQDEATTLAASTDLPAEAEARSAPRRPVRARPDADEPSAIISPLPEPLGRCDSFDEGLKERCQLVDCRVPTESPDAGAVSFTLDGRFGNAGTNYVLHVERIVDELRHAIGFTDAEEFFHTDTRQFPEGATVDFRCELGGSPCNPAICRRTSMRVTV